MLSDNDLRQFAYPVRWGAWATWADYVVAANVGRWASKIVYSQRQPGAVEIRNNLKMWVDMCRYIPIMGDIQHKAKGQAMLSRKVYEQIAASVKKSVDKADETLDANLYGFATEMAEELADYFASDNPRFDRGRFLDACGLGSRMLASEHVHTN